MGLLTGELLGLLDLDGGRNAVALPCNCSCCGFDGTKRDFCVALGTFLEDTGAVVLEADGVLFTDGAMVGGVNAKGMGTGRCGFDVDDGAAPERDGFG